jgi:hypothetical protein
VLRFFVVLGLLTCACGADAGEEQEPPCVALPAECPDVLEPVFSRLYPAIFQRGCSQGDGSCHGANAREGGMDLSNADTAYAELLGTGGDAPRVKPEDPACSKLVVRTHSIGKPWQMPPGTPLQAFELCAIRTWILERAPQ